MKLLIRNLDRETTKEELISLFGKCGTVESCTLVIDKETGLSKGFGFIEIPLLSEAKDAILTFNNKTVGGNKIRVKKAENKPHN